VYEVAVDTNVASLARKLLRTHNPPLKKPNDAIHLATAALYNLDEMHTYDNDDLLRLDGLIERKDSAMLRICTVPDPSGRQDSLSLDSGDTGEPDESTRAP